MLNIIMMHLKIRTVYYFALQDFKRISSSRTYHFKISVCDEICSEDLVLHILT
jgi:hypothetical protein